MAQQTIQIADKPTLDEVKTTTKEIKESLKQSSGGVECVSNRVQDGAIFGTNEIVSEVYNQISIANRGKCVVFRDEIHMLSESNHYKLDKNTSKWVKVSTPPYSYYGCAVVVYHDAIYIIGGYDSSNDKRYYSCYKWDGSTWTKLEDVPYAFHDGYSFVYHDKLHIMCGGHAGNTSYSYHYTYDEINNRWHSVGNLTKLSDSLSSSESFSEYDAKNSVAIVNDTVYVVVDNIYLYRYVEAENGFELVTSFSDNFRYNGGCTIIGHNGKLNILYSRTQSDEYYMYRSIYDEKDNSIYVVEKKIFNHYANGEYNINPKSAFVFNDYIYVSSYYRLYKLKSYFDRLDLYLQTGNKLICDTGKVFPISDNIETVGGVYVCKKTGLCKFAYEYDVNEESGITYTII